MYPLLEELIQRFLSSIRSWQAAQLHRCPSRVLFDRREKRGTRDDETVCVHTVRALLFRNTNAATFP